MKYKNIEKSNPKEAVHLMNLPKEMVDLWWQSYGSMNGRDADSFTPMS